MNANIRKLVWLSPAIFLFGSPAVYAQQAETKIIESGKNSAATASHSVSNSSQGWPKSDANSPLSQAVEKNALELLATAPVRQAVAQGLKTLEASDAASKPEALRFVRSALEETAMFASLKAAMGASPEPSRYC